MIKNEPTDKKCDICGHCSKDGDLILKQNTSKTDQIELALANIRESIKITKEYDVLVQLWSAEHHLIRSEW